MLLHLKPELLCIKGLTMYIVVVERGSQEELDQYIEIEIQYDNKM